MLLLEARPVPKKSGLGYTRGTLHFFILGHHHDLSARGIRYWDDSSASL